MTPVNAQVGHQQVCCRIRIQMDKPALGYPRVVK
jgi:hypothetical protein